jgi:hypothetical protein
MPLDAIDALPAGISCGSGGSADTFLAHLAAEVSRLPGRSESRWHPALGWTESTRAGHSRDDGDYPSRILAAIGRIT